MLIGCRENRIAQQDPKWTAISAATGNPARGAPYQHQCVEALLCYRRCLGTLPPAAVPVIEDSFPASARALSLRASPAAFGHAAGKSRADRQHPVLLDGRGGAKGSCLGLGAWAVATSAVCRR